MKKQQWIAPEGLKISWSPTNAAFFALWPSSEPIERQQVLKVADADTMHSWLRSRYGEPYGLKKYLDRDARKTRKARR